MWLVFGKSTYNAGSQVTTRSRLLRHFIDVKSAVCWADGYSSRVSLGSSLGHLVLSGPDWEVFEPGLLSDMDPIDKRCLALTILAKLGDIKPWAGSAYRAVLCRKDIGLIKLVANEMTGKLWILPVGKEKGVPKLLNLSESVIYAERRKRLHGKKTSLSQMAGDIGVSRKQFTSSMGWPRLRVEAYDQLYLWLSHAQAVMSDFLDGLEYR